MPRKGQIRFTSCTTLHVAEVIEGLDETFPEADLIAECVRRGLPEMSVKTTITNKLNQGCLTREGKNIKKVPHAVLVKRLPNAVVCESLWDVLMSHRGAPCREDVLAIETERKVAVVIGKGLVDTSQHVKSLLRKWTRDGYLRPYGGFEPGDRSYIILAGIKTRPPTS